MWTLIVGGISGQQFSITRDDAARLYADWERTGTPQTMGRADRLVILLESDHAQIVGPAMMQPSEALALIA